jgi:hypothetical protein
VTNSGTICTERSVICAGVDDPVLDVDDPVPDVVDDGAKSVLRAESVPDDNASCRRVVSFDVVPDVVPLAAV